MWCYKVKLNHVVLPFGNTTASSNIQHTNECLVANHDKFVNKMYAHHQHLISAKISMVIVYDFV